MPSRLAIGIAIAMLLGWSTAPAVAHTKVASTTPASGSVLTRSPEAVEITFTDAARLTSVVVLDAAKNERRLAFAPTGSALAFTVEEPQLERGRNEIRWKALSQDGHVISGSLIFVVADAAQPR
jgi:copper resistance protein C